MRRTIAEMETMENWEKSVARPDDNNATDVYLDQLVLQIAQPLMDRFASLLVPHEVRVSPCGNYIEWRGKYTIGESLSAQVMKERVSPAHSLQAFILLSGERKNGTGFEEGGGHHRLIEFLKKWGPLNLYPEIHSADTPEDEAKSCAWIAEPVAVYRQHARRMWGLLAVAAAVHQGTDPTQDEWAAAADDLELPDPSLPCTSNAIDLASLIDDHYMRDLQIRPVLTVRNDRPKLTLDIDLMFETNAWDTDCRNWVERRTQAKMREMEAQGFQVDVADVRAEAEKQFRPTESRPSKLLNCLVLQLLSTVTSGLYRCSMCTMPYVPTRKPRSENHFCEDCQPIAHRRRSKVSYQKRKINVAN